MTFRAHPELARIALLAVLALAGCGGDDDTRSSEGSGASGGGATSSSVSTSSSGGTGTGGGSASTGTGTGGTGGSASTGTGTGGVGGTGGSGASGGASAGGAGGAGGTGGAGGAGGSNMLCMPGETASCYGGPDGTEGIGACKAGVQTCNDQGAEWGPCVGEVLPQPETCNTPVDDDCNGQTNEGGAGCGCVPNSTVSCYTGPAGTQGVGNCAPGTQTCNPQGTALGACSGDVTPKIENCVVAGDENCDGSSVCSGNYRWSKAGGSAIDDEGTCVATDSSGNVALGGYVSNTWDYGCGPLTGSAAGSAMVMKLDSNGDCLWSKSFGADASTSGVAFDTAGNVYATGTFKVSIDFGGGAINDAGGGDIFVVKLSPTGAFLWAKGFGDATQQLARGIATDPSNNVLLSGFTLGTSNFGGGVIPNGGAIDLYVAKLSPTGNHIWSKGFGAAGNQFGRLVASDPAGNVIIAGEFSGSVNFGGGTLTSLGLNDVYLAKLSPGGAHLWSKRFGDSTDQTDYGLAVDSAGNVYASGAFSGTVSFGGASLTSAGGYDVWVAKYDPSGNHLWSKRFGGAGNQNSDGGCTVDPLGNVTIAGALQQSADYGGGVLTSAGANDIAVAKYDTSGNHLWSKRFGDAAEQTPKGIASDPSGNMLVTGLIMSPTDFGGGPISGLGGEDVWVVSLGP